MFRSQGTLEYPKFKEATNEGRLDQTAGRRSSSAISGVVSSIKGLMPRHYQLLLLALGWCREVKESFDLRLS